MKVHRLNKKQKISKNISEVFDFFSRPENLARITPKRLGFNIMTPSPIKMKEGQLIDYTINILAVPIRWTTMITEYEPPFRFVDQQIKGPYSMWHHTHTFKEVDKNETLIEDLILYTMPLGPVGNAIRNLYVKRDLENIFKYREKTINEIFSLSNYSTKGEKNI